MKLQITITKDILQRSMMCGTVLGQYISQSCAIAVAIGDLFPGVCVGVGLESFSIDETHDLSLPVEAAEFIKTFDRLATTPEQRLELPETSFVIELPDDIIVTPKVLKKCKHITVIK